MQKREPNAFSLKKCIKADHAQGMNAEPIRTQQASAQNLNSKQTAIRRKKICSRGFAVNRSMKESIE